MFIRGENSDSILKLMRLTDFSGLNSPTRYNPVPMVTQTGPTLQLQPQLITQVCYLHQTVYKTLLVLVIVCSTAFCSVHY